jgi:hypothetical protein
MAERVAHLQHDVPVHVRAASAVRRYDAAHEALAWPSGLVPYIGKPLGRSAFPGILMSLTRA